jgi:hypothetical protein
VRPPNVLVGIPTYKRPAQLWACLQSIACQKAEGLNVRVFVADNDPDAQEGRYVVERMAPGYPFPLSCEIVSKPGLSATRNAILAEGYKSEYLAMIDDDQTASENWLANLVSVIRKTGAGAVGGYVRYDLGDHPEIAPVFHSPDQQTGLVESLSDTGNVLVQMRSLWKLGKPSFDPAFGLSGGEDMDWFTELKRRGLRFAWAKEAVVTEVIPPDRLTLRYARSRARLRGNVCTRIVLKHRQEELYLRDLAQVVGAIVLSPFMWPLLLTQRRVWLLTRWSRARGKLDALRGVTLFGYSRSPARDGAR